MDGFTRHHYDTTLHPRVPLCQASQCWRGAGKACEMCNSRLCALHRNGKADGRTLCLPCYADQYDLYGRRKVGVKAPLVTRRRDHAAVSRRLAS